jgi:catechol-2,3-dioxygenase
MNAFDPRQDLLAISHLNVVVENIEVATELYTSVLGFAIAANAECQMDDRGARLCSFVACDITG